MGNQTSSKRESRICISQNLDKNNFTNSLFYYLDSLDPLPPSKRAVFREVLYTSHNLMQFVKMQLLPNQEIGLESHADTDQFFLIQSGKGRAEVGFPGQESILTLGPSSTLIVSSGTPHNIINESNSDLLTLYTIYTPAEHPKSTLQILKPKSD